MIPRTLHRIWLGSEMPEEFVEYGRKWKRLHPDWELADWLEIPRLRNQALFDRAEDLSSSIWQFRSDIARYEILYYYGGVYVDTDMDPQRPIDDLIKDAKLFAAREDNFWINNAFMGCYPKDPFLLTLIEHLPQSVQLSKKPNVATGPQYLTKQYIKHRPEITLFPREVCYPYLWNDLRPDEVFPDAYMIHRWNNRRGRK